MSDDNSVMTAERLAREVAAEMREKHPGWAVSVDGSTSTYMNAIVWEDTGSGIVRVPPRAVAPMGTPPSMGATNMRCVPVPPFDEALERVMTDGADLMRRLARR